MGKTLQKNLPFFLPYGIILLVTGILIFLFDKGETHLFFNRFHSDSSDVLFKWLTFLGDGVTAGIVTAVLLFFRYRLAIINAMAYLSSGLVVQIMKRLLFENIARPMGFFDENISLHLVEGIKMYTRHGFPSGHTASAFALFTVLTLLSRQNPLKVTWLILAILVGYSRIYLSLHFLPDVWAGSLIGCLAGLLSWHFMQKPNKNWLDRGINLFGN